MLLSHHQTISVHCRTYHVAKSMMQIENFSSNGWKFDDFDALWNSFFWDMDFVHREFPTTVIISYRNTYKICDFLLTESTVTIYISMLIYV